MSAARTNGLIDRRYSDKVHKLILAVAALAAIIYAGLLPTIWIWPEFGLRFLWFLVIPLAPMVLLAAPNVWVSICPISTFQTLGRKLGWKGGKRLSPEVSAKLQTFGWALMFVGIPTRHLWFNTIGWATASVAIAITLVAVGAGLFYFTLSGWCVGACPIRPIEVLYGQFARERNRPEMCRICDACVPHCIRLRPEKADGELTRLPLALHLTFGFPGFVAAYFLLDLLYYCNVEHVFFGTSTDAPAHMGIHALTVYGGMAAGFFVTFLLFHGLRAIGVNKKTLILSAAIAAYSFYYLGVVPEIVEAWALSSALGWAILAVPAIVLGTVLFVPGTTRRRLTPLKVKNS
ncbi:MAG: hypothetical protein IH944_11625 [Armatimonadetes bacterium]|nr:hypothetical protein [Armatimonadota bacterium]